MHYVNRAGASLIRAKGAQKRGKSTKPSNISAEVKGRSANDL